MWMWWSRGIGGRSALDYLIKIEGLSFVDAVKKIMDKQVNSTPKRIIVKPKSNKYLLLPEANQNANTIYQYLTLQRGIDEEIVSYCIEKGYIYESAKYHSAIFVGYDEYNKPKYASYRNCTPKREMGDCMGSNKEYSFRLVNKKNNTVHLFESAIDLLSYATLLKLNGKRWQDYNLLSLSGVYQPKAQIEESKVPIALAKYLELNPQIKTIYLHFDNDNAGKLITKTLKIILPKSLKVIDCHVPEGKDVNDFLCIKTGLFCKEKANECVR